MLVIILKQDDGHFENVSFRCWTTQKQTRKGAQKSKEKLKTCTNYCPKLKKCCRAHWKIFLNKQGKLTFNYDFLKIQKYFDFLYEKSLFIQKN